MGSRLLTLMEHGSRQGKRGLGRVSAMTKLYRGEIRLSRVSLAYGLSPAHFADRDQSFRSIVITRFGDRDRAERRWTGLSFAFSGPFVETLL